jgi:thymidylate synthase
MRTIVSQTADEAWSSAFRLLTRGGAGTRQESRQGPTDEALHVAFEIAQPRERWVVSRRPALNPGLAIAEVFWILAGSNASGIVNHWFPGLAKFSGDGPTYYGAYGHRLRRQFGFDQIARAVDALSADPTTRQVALSIWDPRTDLPTSDGKPRSRDIPCNVLSLLKVRDGRLDWTQFMRSNDLDRGLPNNLVQFTTIQEIVAGWLGVEVGSYHHWSDSLHVYVDPDRELAIVPSRAEPNTDSLALDRSTGQAVIAAVFGRMEWLSSAPPSAQGVREFVDMPDVPRPYRNLLAVMGAESARRYLTPDLAEEVMSTCTNPALRQVWNAWMDRKAGESRGGQAR